MTNTLLTGPSLLSKPLQEHKLIIIMELHHYLLSNTLLFIFQIIYTLVKSILLMPKWNFWNPVAKFDIDPGKYAHSFHSLWPMNPDPEDQLEQDKEMLTG